MANTPYNNPTGTGMDKPARLDTDALRNDASGVVDEVKAVAGKITDEAKTTAGTVMEQAKAQASEAAEKAKSIASEQKDLLAEQLGGISGAVRRAAEDLEGQNAPTAQYARMVADGADRLTSLVRDNDVDGIMAAAQDFGRRQPAAFLGAAALLGFAASRFVTASAKRQQERDFAAQSNDPIATQTPGMVNATDGYEAGRV